MKDDTHQAIALYRVRIATNIFEIYLYLNPNSHMKDFFTTVKVLKGGTLNPGVVDLDDVNPQLRKRLEDMSALFKSAFVMGIEYEGMLSH